MGIEEEVVACVRGSCCSWVQDGEMTDTGENEILEDRGGGCGSGGDEDASGLESCLA